MNKDCKKSGPFRVRLATENEKELPTVIVELFSLREKAPTKNTHCYSRHFSLKGKAPTKNKSRICGKGVGLGLFPSDSLQSKLYEFIETAHIDHTMV